VEKLFISLAVSIQNFIRQKRQKTPKKAGGIFKWLVYGKLTIRRVGAPHNILPAASFLAPFGAFGGQYF